jgi:hypothetical protein
MGKTDAESERLHDHCAQMIEHIKLLRDFATTPGNIWLARSELNRINQMAAEMEQILSSIKSEK